MSKYTEELKYFSDLQKNCTCKGCGEEIHGEKCICCGAEIEHAKFIIENVKKIIDTLPKENVGYSTDINLLYKMRNIDVVGTYINEIGYYEILEKKKEENFSKDYNDLTDNEIEDREFLTEYFLSEDEKANVYNDALFVRCLSNQNRYSPLFIEKSYSYFVDMITKKTKLYGETNVIDMGEKSREKGMVGLCSGLAGKISVDRQGIIELCNGNPEVFATFFHEFRHREQRKMIYGIIDNQEPAVLLWAKENILTTSLPDYYKANYNIVSFEEDAFINECTSVISLPYLPEDKKDKYRQELQELTEIDNKYGIMRLYGDKFLTVEDIFDKTVKLTDEMLQKMPILNYQYIKDEETKEIRHRTIEEINEYMEETSEGKTNLEGREKLKSYLIEFEKQRQESAKNLEIEGAKKV